MIAGKRHSQEGESPKTEFPPEPPKLSKEDEAIQEKFIGNHEIHFRKTDIVHHVHLASRLHFDMV